MQSAASGLVNANDSASPQAAAVGRVGHGKQDQAMATAGEGRGGRCTGSPLCSIGSGPYQETPMCPKSLPLGGFCATWRFSGPSGDAHPVDDRRTQPDRRLLANSPGLLFGDEHPQCHSDGHPNRHAQPIAVRARGRDPVSDGRQQPPLRSPTLNGTHTFTSTSCLTSSSSRFMGSRPQFCWSPTS